MCQMRPQLLWCYSKHSRWSLTHHVADAHQISNKQCRFLQYKIYQNNSLSITVQHGNAFTVVTATR